ncbi:KUP/HAK/KT family potassium transporter [Pararhizobium sp. PWRC1-1]|uniref:KUP/HAK/KT family potassium transporter n=1 Tax=Pararhizobium sp. PWRC1-1 TaxID=2804566 RepID=UPI003CE7B968
MGDRTPPVLLHNTEHNRVLHKKNVILTVRTSEKPYVADDKRATITLIDVSFARVSI